MKKHKAEKETCKDKVYSLLVINNMYLLPENISKKLNYKLSTVKRALSELLKEEKVTFLNLGHREYIDEDTYKYVKYWGAR